jgi:peptide-methionine (S)-S-oxide reductase
VGFHRSKAEKKIFENAIAAINASGQYKNKVATEVSAFRDFERAENEHQEYVSKHPDQVYVKYYNIPDYIHFRRNFPGPYKDTLVSQ